MNELIQEMVDWFEKRSDEYNVWFTCNNHNAFVCKKFIRTNGGAKEAIDIYVFDTHPNGHVVWFNTRGFKGKIESYAEFLQRFDA